MFIMERFYNHDLMDNIKFKEYRCIYVYMTFKLLFEVLKIKIKIKNSSENKV